MEKLIQNFKRALIEAMEQYQGLVMSVLNDRKMVHSEVFGVSKVENLSTTLTTDTIFH